MSAEATGYVFRCSPFTGATFTAHLAIADSVNDQHGNEFFMSIGNLAKKARTDRRTAQRAMRALTARGFLTPLSQSKGDVYRYRFEFCPQPAVYESRGRREVASPATSGASKGRSVAAQSQRRTQENAGATQTKVGLHLAGSGNLVDFRKEREA